MKKLIQNVVKAVRRFFARHNEIITLGGMAAVAALPRHYESSVGNAFSKIMTFSLVSNAIDRIADGDKMSEQDRARSTMFMSQMVFVLAAYKVAAVIFNINPLCGSMLFVAVTILSYQMK